VSSDGSSLIATFSTESKSLIQSWNLESRQATSPWIEGAPLRLLSKSKDGHLIATSRGVSTSRGHLLNFWSVVGGRNVGVPIRIDGFTGPGTFSPDGSVFAIASHTNPMEDFADVTSLQFWRTQDGEPAIPTTSWSGDPGIIRYDPTGRLLVLSLDNRLHFLESRTGRPTAPPISHRGQITSAHFSPDGRFVCTTDGSMNMYVYETERGQPVVVPVIHPEKVRQAIFTPDNKRIVTSCGDGLIRFWDLTAELGPVDELAVRAQLLAGHAIDETGALAPLSTRDFEKQWARWIAMRADVLPEVPESLIEPDLPVPRDTDWMESELLVVASAAAKTPTDTMAAMRLASLQVWLGKEIEHEATCEGLLRTAMATKNAEVAERVAKICSLRPVGNILIREAAVKSGRKAVERGAASQNLPWYQMALGMAEYRADNHGAAEKTLLTAVEGAVRIANPEWIYHIGGTARFYLAMSQFKQGRQREARQTFDQTTARMNPLPTLGENPLAGEYAHDDMILWLAYKEARSMLADSVSSEP
jgi:hypothetical protein